MESTVRINLTSLTNLELMKREPIASKEHFQQLVEDLFQRLNHFSRFDALRVTTEIFNEVLDKEVEDTAWESFWEVVEESIGQSQEEMEADLPGHDDAMETEDATIKEPEDEELLYREGGLNKVLESDNDCYVADLITVGLMLLASKSSTRWEIFTKLSILHRTQTQNTGITLH